MSFIDRPTSVCTRVGFCLGRLAREKNQRMVDGGYNKLESSNRVVEEYDGTWISGFKKLIDENRPAEVLNTTLLFWLQVVEGKRQRNRYM